MAPAEDVGRFLILLHDGSKIAGNPVLFHLAVFASWLTPQKIKKIIYKNALANPLNFATLTLLGEPRCDYRNALQINIFFSHLVLYRCLKLCDFS